MRTSIIILGIAAGAAVAWVLNTFLSRKIENKSHRIGLQVAAYIVFVLLGFLFTSIFSLRIVLDTFIDNRIQAMEASLSKRFPNSNILEETLDTAELVSLNEKIQQSLSDIDTEGDGFLKRLVFDAFIGKLTSYISAVDSGVAAVSNMSDDDGSVTVKALLYNFKDMGLDAASPYFAGLQIVILVLFVIAIGIYVGIVVYINKGGAMYNKSIVYGPDVEEK